MVSALIHYCAPHLVHAAEGEDSEGNRSRSGNGDEMRPSAPSIDLLGHDAEQALLRSHSPSLSSLGSPLAGPAVMSSSADDDFDPGQNLLDAHTSTKAPSFSSIGSMVSTRGNTGYRHSMASDPEHSTWKSSLQADRMSLVEPEERIMTPKSSRHALTGTANCDTRVREEAFLSVGLQTSLAIVLHKIPEGFITYASNHADTKLGMAVFLALFVHSVTEGFAMSLPLYISLSSRLKAVVWATLVGCTSQPLGAAGAVVWFRLTDVPANDVYGAIFALTAGVMTSLAFSLFTEALMLSSNVTLCNGFAFLGMAILGGCVALSA